MIFFRIVTEEFIYLFSFFFSFQAHGNSTPNLPTSSLSSFLPSTTSISADSKASLSGPPRGGGGGGTTTLSSVSSNQPGQGVDLSQAAAMANVRTIKEPFIF